MSKLGAKKRRSLVEALIERDGIRCTWCCREMVQAPIHPFEDCSLHMTVEHLLPLSEGGTHDLQNLALACYLCNNTRASDLSEFCPPWAVVD